VLKKAIMKFSTFIVFAYFCVLFIVRIIEEVTSLAQRFGTTTILVKGYEIISLMSILGIILMAFIIVKIADWIFFDKEDKKELNKELNEEVVE